MLKVPNNMSMAGRRLLLYPPLDRDGSCASLAVITGTGPCPYEKEHTPGFGIYHYHISFSEFSILPGVLVVVEDDVRRRFYYICVCVCREMER